MLASVFVGASVDGFIARVDGGLDWLPGDDCEAHGYEEFMDTVDALVMGRNTFDIVLGFGEWPFSKPVFVLTSRPLTRVPPGAVLEAMAGDPAEIVSALEARGFRHLYVDGGITIQGFLRAGLIQRLVVTRVPVLIGEGIPLFGSLPADERLRHVATRTFPSGLVQSEYVVVGAAGAGDVTTRLW
ncbi:MAG: dihydrofolate reductase [Blastocatellia bacterium]|nr:dihydrofolate reductase [Blastocatellia bacterium]MBK6425408.1 dihydrofolate reductase [Blastocatellia bacterium]